MEERSARIGPTLKPDKVAYWYFRLNGFLQIENYIVHPGDHGGQRTDADLLGVRFPHRAEFLIDHPDDPMVDDEDALKLSRHLIDVVIAEITTRPCKLNGPWTDANRQNVHRVLAAMGCIRREQINGTAAALYRAGHHETDGLRVRLIAIGRERDDDLGIKYPEVLQLTWSQVLDFMWRRFNTYRHQKRQVDQWDVQGTKLKKLADKEREPSAFRVKVLALMGVHL